MEGPATVPLPRRGITNPNDREMVVAFKGGDSHAYALIYREYRPVAESICQRILGNQEDAAEAAQETMLRVFQGLSRFNGRYLLRAWVARIATNVCLDMIRKRGRRPDEFGTSEPEDLEVADRAAVRSLIEDPGEVVERIHESERVRSLLDELPPHHRDALLMREYDGLSHEEIGSKMGMTAPQVKALLHRAKKGLKRAWDVDSGRASMFAPVLLFPIRLLRKIFHPVRDAVSEVGAPVIHLGAQPAVQQVTFALSDRAGAAAGAILVAGTIGLGAVALPNRQLPQPKIAKPQVSVVEPAPEVSAGRPIVIVPAPSPQATSSVAAVGPRERPVPDPVTGPQSPAPEVQPSPDASRPDPTPDPPSSPTPDPAPPYSMSFLSAQRTDRRCGCDAAGRLVENEGTVKSGSTTRFGQAAVGAVVDSEGAAAFDLHVEYDGTVEGATGTLDVYFRLTDGSDVYTYRASLTLKRYAEFDFGWTWSFGGSYSLVGGPSNGFNPIPRSGLLSSSLSVWNDGTIYGADFKAS